MKNKMKQFEESVPLTPLCYTAKVIKMITRLLFLVACLGFSQIAMAALVPHLYQTDVSVSSTSDKDRLAALKPALKNVLIKVSGSPKKIQGLSLPSDLNFDNVVTQYRYTQTPEGKSLLVLSFDPEFVDNFLQDHELNAWGNNRPLILVILLVKNARGQIELLSSATENNPEIDYVGSEAKRLGLPVIFPLGDALDNTLFDKSALWNNHFESLRTINARYGNDVTIIATFQTDPEEQVYSQWTLLPSNPIDTQSLNASAFSIVTEEGMENIAANLASNFVHREIETTTIDVGIQSIANAASFDKAKQSLAHINGVTHCVLTKLTPTEIWFSLAFDGNIALFDKNSALDKNFIALNTLPSPEARNPVREYQWID
jgi:hypothetical protein